MASQTHHRLLIDEQKMEFRKRIELKNGFCFAHKRSIYFTTTACIHEKPVNVALEIFLHVNHDNAIICRIVI